MIKKIFLAFLFVVILAGSLAGIKAWQIQKMMALDQSLAMPPTVVSTVNATTQVWESILPAVGTITAVQGVLLTAEVPGRVVSINFESGDQVQAGQALVHLDVSTEEAQWRALEARSNLAHLNLKRMKTLLAQGTSTQSEYDAAQASYDQLEAEKDALQSLIAKKTIRAPFAGVLGLRQVNLGQNLGSGDKIAALQHLDTVQVEFTLPQQQIGPIKPGTLVRVHVDTGPDVLLTAQVQAVEPLADSATRTVRVQAVVDNANHVLRPGMFVSTEIVLPQAQEQILIPATAVAYAAYGNSVFFVEADADNNALVLRQQFISLGQRRGDFVAVTQGVQVGQTVVSTGVFKYRNGQRVVVDNTLAPEFNLNPQPENS